MTTIEQRPSTTFDPLRLFALPPEATEDRRTKDKERPKPSAGNPVDDTLRIGGAALSTLFPALGAVERGAGITLNPFNMARNLLSNEPGRNLGTLGGGENMGEPKSKERQQWDRYANMVREAGGEVNPDGKPTVLGIRNVDGASSQYGDKFVVLTPDHKVHTFRGSTHPGQSSSSLATDANGDGVGDVGMLRPGNYVASANGAHSGAPSFHVTSKSGSDPIPGFRDTNHDGQYSGAEKRASRDRGDKVTEILFHTGGSGAVSSIGCMNLPPASIDRFNRVVGGQGSDGFNFTLVNA